MSFAATFTVNSTTDAVDATPGDGICATAGGVCTLRAAIQEANALAGADTITLPAGTYTLTIPGIDSAGAVGDLDINGDVTINGAGMSSTIIDGNGGVVADRVIDIAGGAVTISDLTIKNGNVTGNGGGIRNAGAALTLTRVAVTNNTASGTGGGIDNASTLTLNDVDIYLNVSSVDGGGVDSAASITWNRGTVRNNTGLNGGGLKLAGTGGGITYTLTNVTVSNNTASSSGIGGGIHTTKTVTLANVTVAQNKAGSAAGSGGGLRTGGAGAYQISNSIVAANTLTDGTTPDNCSAAFTSAGYNLESATNTCGFAGAGDQNSVTAGNLNIGPLANNGGPTQTHALLTGSFAIDRIPNGTNGCGTTITTDQRGVARPQNGTCDVGAYEAVITTIGNGFNPSNKTVNPSDTNKAVDAFTLSTGSGADTLTGLTVTFTGTNVGDVAASGVKIYRDNGSTPSEWDSGDTLIATGSFSGGTATFSGLNVNVTTTSTQYLITYDISASAAVGDTLQGKVTAATVSNPLANNDITNATLTVNKCPGGVVTTTADTGNGSLRECINAANTLSGQQTITFSGGVFAPGTINVASALPPLMNTSGIIIDGGAAANVIINGGGISTSGFTLAGNSNNNQIKNVTIQNFGQYGIVGNGSNDATQIRNNVIKTNGGATTVGGVLLLSATNSVIDGNTINNNTNRGVSLSGSSNTNTITNNQIYSNGGVGIEIINGSSGNTIQGNTVYSNGATQATKYGIYLDNNSTNNNVISMNLVRNNSGAGIQVGTGTTVTGTKIYQNTIHSNTGDGIAVGASSTSTIIKNNILTSNTAWGVNTAVAATISNNDYFGNTSGTCTGTGCPGAGSITTDPQYVNAAANNYNLTACTSPAINAGVDLGVDQPDMNGAGPGNYYGAAPDMGAFESSCGFSPSLVKQVWQVGGSAPLAASNGSPTSTTVPSGQTIVFLIYVKNTTASALTDIRFSDLLDVTASGFSYVAGSLVRTSAASPPADSASDLTIFNATAPGTGTNLTDGVDADVASICDSTAGACPGATLDRVTVGNTAGLTPAQANGTLSVAANSAFAIQFRAIKK